VNAKQFLTLFLIVVCLFIHATVLAGQLKVWREDINKDGISEIIRYKEYQGGMNVWGQLQISRKGQLIFDSDPLCVTWGKQGYFLLDMDRKRPGKEVVTYYALGEVAEYKPDRFMFCVYHWQNDKYVLEEILYSSGKYQTGKEAKQELIRGKAKPRLVNCYVVIGGKYKTFTEARKANKKLQQYIEQHVGDVYGYDIDKSEHYRGLKPGYWILLTGFYDKKSAEEWVGFVGERGGSKSDIRFVTKMCPCQIFHSRNIAPTGAFPYNTELAGIRCRMSLKEVVARLGSKYKIFRCSASTETPTWCIAYNDPTGKGSILIDTGIVDKKFANTVCSIILSLETIPGAPKAKIGLVGKGTAEGVRLGFTLKQVKEVYPNVGEPMRWGEAYFYQAPIPSPKDWPCLVGFWVKRDRVVKIFVGFMP